MRPLRVGLNLTYLVEDSGGSGTYARQLLPALLALEPTIELTAWVGSMPPAWIRTEPWASDIRWVKLPVPGTGPPWHLAHELLTMGLDARRRELDLIHGLANLVPLAGFGTAIVVTILDVIWIHHPGTMGLRARLAMRMLAPMCGRIADRVIAISHAAADDVANSLRIPASRLDVTPLGVNQGSPLPPADLEGVREELGLTHDPLILCVAAKRAHKNLDGLIRALALLPEPRPQLVLPGSPTEYERHLRAQALELSLDRHVHFPGWVAAKHFEALYAMASCFVLPSFQEGFGLPVLEAMRRGVPVACAGVSSLPELAGDSALLFDPHSAQSIADAIARLLGDAKLTDDLAQRGRERSRMFTWKRTAELTLASYRRALENQSRCTQA